MNNLSKLEARGVEPVSYVYVRQDPGRALSERIERISCHGNAWMEPDVISIVIGWPVFGDIRSRSIGQLVFVTKAADSAGSRRKKRTKRRRSRSLKSSRERQRPNGHLSKSKLFWTGYTKRSLANALFERHLENLSDWLTAKKAETASSTMDFYQGSLRKFLQYLGQRADETIAEITKQDVVAFRHSLVGQVSAKTANHDLKALKMLFKSARRDSAITEDPTEFVETVRRENRMKIKRPFTLPELRSVLDLASDEW